MYEHEVQIRVRYADTDQMGYVYYGNYAAYYEVARVEAFRALGFAYKQMEEEGVMMPVLDLKSEFLKPAIYDDLLTVRVCVPEKPRARIRYEYEVFNEAGVLLNRAETTLVFIDMKSGRPTRPPKIIAELFGPFFEE